MNEEILRSRSDLNRISERTKTLRVDMPLKKEDAVNIMRRCRTLQEVVFDYKAFAKTEEEAKEYLGKWVYLDYE